MSRIQVSKCIPKKGLSRTQRKVYKAIAEVLDAHGYEVDEWYRDRMFADKERTETDSDLRGALGCVFYEGHDFAHFFSMDAAYEAGYLVYQYTGKSIGPEAYKPYEDMQETLNQHGFYMEQAWAKAVIYPA